MTLRVLVHDVGHGQAIHAFTPAGETVVIDLGCSSSFSPLEWLRKQKSTIDSLVISHPHGDHIDEILKLEELGFDIRQLWRPKWLERERVENQNQGYYSEKLDAYFRMSDRFNQPIEKSERVGNPDVSGVSIEHFASKECGQSNINNHSGVVVFTYAGSTVIISGDNEPSSWKALMENPKFANAMKRADIFMASHHGRKSGYCSEIFSSKPKLCVISDGRVQSTDATSRYSHHASGWEIHHRSGADSEERYCLTTRSDGFIDIKLGTSGNGKNFLSVTVN